MERGDAQHLADLGREICGLAFGIFIGPLPQELISVQERLQSLPDPEASIMIGIDPVSRFMGIATGGYAQSRVNDQACSLAILAMQSTITTGGMEAALRDGVALLAEHARAPHTEHLGEPA